MKLVLGSLLVLALPLAAAYADAPRRHPPQVAFDACAKAKADDACSFKLRDHEIKGKCATARESSALVCRPEHMGPPPEAIAACNGHAQGDACSMTRDGHEVAGACMHARNDRPLACRPAGAAHPH
ncbi:MAG TPA: hypothetical protein VHW23_34970 [Kofleriaceae bacterium]|jgi:hypothetical protein|nr:hypothetical protein [Kofleriaceae bacterium]